MSHPPSLAVHSYRTLRRVFPRCGMVSQAVAFNLFLAFFPALLIGVAVVGDSSGVHGSALEMVRELRRLLPSSSRQFVEDYVAKHDVKTWKLATLGWTGLLLAGSQAMRLIVDGIHTIYGDERRPGFLHQQVRGFLILLATMVPAFVAASLGVLGVPLRRWLAQDFGHPAFLRTTWAILFPLVGIVFGTIALTMLYWIARSGREGLRQVLPGALVATVIWWLVDVLFSAYVRRVHYGLIYGGLAAVVGLMIWMQISSVIVFVGAAWNAESEAGYGSAR
ncbi:MAG TPA: YihY/virulence factor BrkB family protein [Methylomirabilota bacterium]|nr:YihY/virulence factor BrkB family protein [Methylomirabilota bacterium]